MKNTLLSALPLLLPALAAATPSEPDLARTIAHRYGLAAGAEPRIHL